MNWIKYFTYFIFLAFVVSCSQPTIEEDAKNAADLINQSNQAAMDNEVNRAGQTYTKAQEIIRKYRHSPDFDQFYEIYSSFLDINSYNAAESMNTTEESASDN